MSKNAEEAEIERLESRKKHVQQHARAELIRRLRRSVSRRTEWRVDKLVDGSSD